MQCQICKEHTATIHLTEINDGQRRETHLCQECAQKQGLAIKSQIPLNELLTTLLSVQADSNDSLFGEDDTQCPDCGMTLEKFSKQSLLGCPDDYEVFKNQLQMIIEKSQGGSSSHRGKVPSKVPGDTKQKIEIMNLRTQLETAIKNENYETAAKLRDQIEKLNEIE